MPRYIVYACPVGPLAEQLSAYFAASRAACGPNAAHNYMPHITLTGFFQDSDTSLPVYITALASAHQRATAERPAMPIIVTALEINPEFHGLLIEAPWLKALISDFIACAASPTRNEALRRKDWLHLSLAYEFAVEHHTALAEFAQQLVDLQAAAEWELRFYERHADATWTLHAAWVL
jgi:ubiquitin-associated SH3 domain-containing protein